MEGGGGGENPSPPSSFLFFLALVPTLSTNSRGNACYAGQAEPPCIGHHREYPPSRIRRYGHQCRSPPCVRCIFLPKLVTAARARFVVIKRGVRQPYLSFELEATHRTVKVFVDAQQCCRQLEFQPLCRRVRFGAISIVTDCPELSLSLQ